MTTFNEFDSKIRSIIPNADIDVDNYGQLIIYTGLKFDFHGGITNFDPDGPICDICGEPMECSRGEDCIVHAGDWNGETGNHKSCEEEIGEKWKHE